MLKKFEKKVAIMEKMIYICNSNKNILTKGGQMEVSINNKGGFKND